jgi:lipopolysaccharide transport system ATP-binding protein
MPAVEVANLWKKFSLDARNPLHPRVLARMGDIHAFCELGTFLDQPVKRYSSGMYMRLGFAVAAHVEAQILLIDEVLAVGDIGFQEKCLGRLAEQRARGATILFVSHDLNAVKGCCGRVMWLDRGEVREIGDAESVIAHYAESMLPSVRDLSRRPTHRIPTAEMLRDGDGAQPLAPRETLTLTGVTLLNDAGEPADQFRTGERMVIQIDYVAGHPVRELMFAFGIENLNNFICYGTSSQADGITMDIASGPGRVRIIIERLNLLTGTYKITAAARRADTNLEYDILLNAAFFQMRSGSAESGVFYLEHTWEVASTAGVQVFRCSGVQEEANAPESTPAVIDPQPVTVRTPEHPNT